MFEIKKLPAVIGIAVLAALPVTSFADGAAIAKEKCAGCHGEDGNSSDPKVPNIAGFSAVTIVDMLEAYRSGDRKGEKYKPKDGEETDMNAVTKDLNEADSEAVAAYYAGKTFKKAPNKFNAKLAKKGAKIHDKRCEKCHSEGGSLADDDAAILAGQWKEYQQNQVAEEFEGLHIFGVFAMGEHGNEVVARFFCGSFVPQGGEKSEAFQQLGTTRFFGFDNACFRSGGGDIGPACQLTTLFEWKVEQGGEHLRGEFN
jgi:sulfide dehydrogenase cytochrome subunit